VTETLKPDICVIGAGSGGLTVAAAAAAFGVDVVLIEKAKMGGDCLNYGCVPSKALLAAAKRRKLVETASAFGIDTGEARVSFAKVNDHVRSVIAAIAPNDSVERFTAMGVNVIKGTARFIDRNTVEAGGRQIRARRFVIATGSSPFVPPIPGLDDTGYFTNETIFENRTRINHLVVIGGGPIGIEMAQAHHRLGSKVTVVEGMKALGKDDPELTAIVLDRLRQDGITILEDTKVERVERRGKTGVKVVASRNGDTIEIDGSDILVATGRKPNIDNLGLDAAGIRTNRQGIETKKDLRTSNRRVYAIGDVAGGLQFTHVAGYHAGLVLRGILFRLRAVPNKTAVPWATYCDPELAHVGLDEKAARTRHKHIRILRWPYSENDRAVAEHQTTGLIKIVTDRKGRILGASIAGANAGEMINLWSLAVSKRMKVSDIAGYISPYPTMTEIGKRAATSFYAPQTRRPIVRKIIGFLRKFG
jgi:pyruvate/2-oxoglutarate dehydrogenase complex dihydrolipoamide dehydrogenase (E3) component